MKTVFVNDLKICFTKQKYNPEPDTLLISDSEAVSGFVKRLKSGQLSEDISLQHSDPDKLFLDFAQYFKWMDAAGGVVHNHEYRFLFIKRFGLWDLPKGKVEAGESFEEAALREVSEETGIHSLQILEPLPDTYHIYMEKAHHILKCTHWYAMYAKGYQSLVPQINEQITEARWLNADESREAISTSYRSLKETLSHCFG